jgi:hypothetical protein
MVDEGLRRGTNGLTVRHWGKLRRLVKGVRVGID